MHLVQRHRGAREVRTDVDRAVQRVEEVIRDDAGGQRDRHLVRVRVRVRVRVSVRVRVRVRVRSFLPIRSSRPAGCVKPAPGPPCETSTAAPAAPASLRARALFWRYSQLRRPASASRPLPSLKLGLGFRVRVRLASQA